MNDKVLISIWRIEMFCLFLVYSASIISPVQRTSSHLSTGDTDSERFVWLLRWEISNIHRFFCVYLSVTFDDKEMDIYENCHNIISASVILLSTDETYLPFNTHVDNREICPRRTSTRRDHFSSICSLLRRSCHGSHLQRSLEEKKKAKEIKWDIFFQTLHHRIICDNQINRGKPSCRCRRRLSFEKETRKNSWLQIDYIISVVENHWFPLEYFRQINRMKLTRLIRWHGEREKSRHTLITPHAFTLEG